MNFKTISNLTDITGKRVIVRVDFNVPLGDDGIVDQSESWRIEASMRTINYLREQGARIILISHIGRDPQESLGPVAEFIKSSHIPDLMFIPELVGMMVEEEIDHIQNGGVLLLENLRSNKGEEENDPQFTSLLASYGEIYVNEAFSASHRKHASIVGIPYFIPGFAGFQFADEVAHLEKAENPEHPYVLLLGGAKFETKLPLLKKELDKADRVIVGGALAHTVYSARGYEIGVSLVDDEVDVTEIMNHPKLYVPMHVVVQDEQGNASEKIVTELASMDKIVDIGSASIDEIRSDILSAQTIVWNGPFGWYEKGYNKGTNMLFDLIAKNSGTSILGGGDTVAVLRAQGGTDRFTFVSTAGGAMLDFLIEGTLPGIVAITPKA